MDPIFAGLVLVRWVHFCAIFALFGGALFAATAPPEGEAAQIRRFAVRRAKVAAPVALVSGAGWLAGTIANMAGAAGLTDPDTLHAFFLETIFGPIEAARMALLLVLTGVAFTPLRASARLALSLILSALLLVSQAWLGHAAEGGVTAYGAAMIAAYAVHVLAGAAWLGALPPLLAELDALRRRGAPPLATLRLLARFSTMATAAVVLVLASGLANAAFRVRGHLGAFAGTTYGDILLAKIALVGLMLCFAAYTRLVAMPRLRAGADVVVRATTSTACEIALGVLVLIAAAVLGITPPPA